MARRSRKTFPVTVRTITPTPSVKRAPEILDGIWEEAFNAPRWNVPTLEFVSK